MKPMTKRLFAAIITISMLSASYTALAAETTNQTSAHTPDTTVSDAASKYSHTKAITSDTDTPNVSSDIADTDTPPAKPDGNSDTDTPPAKPDGNSDTDTPPAKPDGNSDTDTPPAKPDRNSDTDTPPAKPDGNSDTDTPPAKPDGNSDKNKSSDSDKDKPTHHKRKRGDINHDEKISAADSMVIQRAVVGLHKLDDTQHLLADVTGDGKVSNADALSILRYSIGSSKKSNIGEELETEE